MALRTLLITLTAATLLAGCGGASAEAQDAPAAAALSDTPALTPYSGLRPTEIYKKVRATTRKFDAVHVQMSSVNAGEALTVDMRVGPDGTAEGSIEPTDGQHLDLLRIGDDAWFKANAAFLDARGLDKIQPDGPWQPVTAKNDLSSYLYYTEIPFYTDDLLKLPKTAVSGIEQVEGSEIDGQLSIGLKVADEPITLFASADGAGELVGYENDAITYHFSDWGEPLEVQAPSVE